ncbi:MAG: MFS transporter [Calothrix sp. MO_192.B10]|nr:MFS transporter [Calothrix sp. MO_192.B10]
MHKSKQLPLSSNHQPTVDRKAIAFIFITVLLDFLGAGILVPIIPFLVGQFNQDALIVGLLGLCFYFAQFIAAPALGLLSDRYGRRLVLLISVIGTGLADLVFGFANALWLLFAARLFDGMTGGNIAVAQAYIADVSSPENRAKNFALIGAAFGIGFVIGPALGGWLSQMSLQAPAFVAGSLSLFSAIWGFFILPESLPRERRLKGAIALQQLNPFRQIREGLQRPALRQFLLANFAQNFAFSALQTNFALFTFVRFGLGPQQNGGIFAYIGIVAIFMQGLITRRLVQRFDEQRLIIVGLASMAVGYATVALAVNVSMLYLAITLLSVGSGIAIPTMTGTISKQASWHQQGAVLGAAQAISSLALIFGPVWAGFTFDYFGANTPYWSSAICLVVAALFAASGASSRHA